jgi:glycosyltransferase involved in cell wall biosynthesis
MHSSISVIIPVFNGEKYLGDAIKSILKQTVQPLEIIVVDDGSTDDTEKVAKNFGRDIQYVYQENSGIPVTRNTGLELAEGEFISFIDADDLWVTNKLEVQLNLLKRNPKYEMVIGFLYRVPFSETTQEEPLRGVKGECATSLGSTLIKKSVFEKIGIFDTEMALGEDVDLFLRVLESGIKVWGHKEIVQLYRQHDENITGDEKRKNYYLLKAFKKSLDRRRKSGDKLPKKIPSFANIGEITQYWQHHGKS